MTSHEIYLLKQLVDVRRELHENHNYTIQRALRREYLRLEEELSYMMGGEGFRILLENKNRYFMEKVI